MIVRNYEIQSGNRNILLVNPPIYDIIDPGKLDKSFMQPSGLLRIATALKNKGAKTSLIDCLIPSYYNKEKIGSKFAGEVMFPLYRIGMSKKDINNKLDNIPKPDEVYVSSGMTYWWQGTSEVIDIIKNKFPKSKVILGGIYPTLVPEHAEKNTRADLVVVGEVPEASNLWQDLSLYSPQEIPESVGIFPSRGCPQKCNYCAQRIINGNKVRAREPLEILDELGFYTENYGIKEFNIWSDNFPFFINQFKGFLGGINQKYKNFGFNPVLNIVKSVDPSMLNEEILNKMLEANVSGYRGELRLALESSNDHSKCEWKRNHTNTKDFEKAVNLARKVSFNDIAAYVLMEAPNESLDNTYGTLNYLKEARVGIIPDIKIDGKTPFTPVPQTGIYKNFIERFSSEKLEDLNGALHPMAKYNGYSIEDGFELQDSVSESNKSLRKFVA